MRVGFITHRLFKAKHSYVVKSICAQPDNIIDTQFRQYGVIYDKVKEVDNDCENVPGNTPRN